MQLRPGITAEQALKEIDEIARGSLNDVQNAIPHQPGDTATRHAVARYDRWTLTAAERLAKLFLDPAVPGQLRQGRYPVILAAVGDPMRTTQLLYAELEELRTWLSLTVGNVFREQIARYSHHRGPTLVLDTNTLLHYNRLDNIPWGNIYGAGAVVVLPHVVVDEIDAKAYTSAGNTGKRVRGVYRLIEQWQAQLDADGHVDLKDARLEILADGPGHRREPNNDNEIISRAVHLQQALGPRRVTLVTRDMGMRARARVWKLTAGPLPERFLLDTDLKAPALDEALKEITAGEDTGASEVVAQDG